LKEREMVEIVERAKGIIMKKSIAIILIVFLNFNLAARGKTNSFSSFSK
jgi:hypothetical protein